MHSVQSQDDLQYLAISAIYAKSYGSMFFFCPYTVFPIKLLPVASLLFPSSLNLSINFESIKKTCSQTELKYAGNHCGGDR